MAYNLIGCIFRGIGDSRTPLFAVAVACVFNIAGDLILCAGFKMGTSGAAFATVFAQIISVIVSFGVIRKKSCLLKCIKRISGSTAGLSGKWWGGFFCHWCWNVFPVIFHGNVLAGIFSSDAMVRIIGAFCVRVPVSWFMSRRAGATLFDIGLATPFSSILQLVLCLGCMLYLRKKKWVYDTV